MTNNKKRPRLLMHLLDERYYCEAPGCPVVCRLWSLIPDQPSDESTTYALGMESPDRRYLYCIGEDEADARSFFETVTEEKLSPVHLPDVIEDRRWESMQGQENAVSCGRDAEPEKSSV